MNIKAFQSLLPEQCGSSAFLPTPSPALSSVTALILHDAAGGKKYFIVVFAFLWLLLKPNISPYIYKPFLFPYLWPVHVPYPLSYIDVLVVVFYKSK